jgi:hypothetical protein
MQIDERIEERVRRAYDAVAIEDGQILTQAFEGLSPEDMAKALNYGLFVVGFITNDVLRNGASDADLAGIAERAIESESSWIELGPKDALVALLRAASKGDTPVPGVPPEDLAGFTFVLGGYLLQSYRLDNQNWWEYLDDIWAQAQTMPDPS